MLDIERIERLIQLMIANDLVEIALRDGDMEVTLRRPNASAHPVIHGMFPAPHPPVAPVAAQSSVNEDDGLAIIQSPMVGTFYAGSSPDSLPFLQVGSEVHAGTVVCILEAMKVFNEIKSEVDGRVERVLAKNAQAVEYGQPLFLIRPH